MICVLAYAAFFTSAETDVFVFVRGSIWFGEGFLLFGVFLMIAPKIRIGLFC